VALLADMLGCLLYISESGSDEEKTVILSRWLFNQDQPAIIATSALGIGFDYPYVRWVIYINISNEASAFS
jgi:superfamily II DNA helicase RecQ